MGVVPPRHTRGEGSLLLDLQLKRRIFAKPKAPPTSLTWTVCGVATLMLSGVGIALLSPSAPALPLPVAGVGLGPLADLEADPWRGPEAAMRPAALARVDVEAPPVASRKLKVRAGDTLMGLLVSAGIDQLDARDAITAMRNVFQPRDLKPGQDLHLAFAPEEGSADSLGGLQLVSLRFQPDPERDIRIDRKHEGPGFTAQAMVRPLTVEIKHSTMVIERSLFEAGAGHDVPPQIMAKVMRAFSHSVDFQREVRKTDELELLYESHNDADGRAAKSGDLLFAALTLSGKRQELYQFTTKSGRGDYYDPEGRSIRKTLLRTPVDGARLSSTYGLRKHPILGYNRMHRGLDFAAPRGTPIFAAGDGVVERIGRNGAYGKYIRLKHNKSFKTAYAHLSRYAKGLERSTRVKQGQVIGYVGTTGRSTGPHLHYEVLHKGRQVNPLKLDLPVGHELAGAELKAFEKVKARIDELRRRRAAPQLVAANETD